MYDDKDIETVKRFREGSDAGDTQCQMALGCAYLLGKGVPFDLVEGVKWLRLAAKSDNLHAQFCLGEVYNDHGKLSPVNYEEALYWYRKAAAHNYKDATEKLHRLERDGQNRSENRIGNSVSNDIGNVPYQKSWQSGVKFFTITLLIFATLILISDIYLPWFRYRAESIEVPIVFITVISAFCLRTTWHKYTKIVTIFSLILLISSMLTMIYYLYGIGLPWNRTVVMYSLVYFTVFSAFCLLVTVIKDMVSHISSTSRHTEDKNMNQVYGPVSKEFIMDNYPGFEVSQNDFTIIEGDIYRINSNGTRINLKKWHFNDDTGEFFMITKRVGTNVIFETMPYNERFVTFHNDNHLNPKGKKAKTLPAAITLLVIFGPLSLLMTYAFFSTLVGPHDRFEPSPVVFLLIGAISYFVFFWILRQVMSLTEENIVGPEPLKRKLSDHGPTKAETTTDHSSHDDLIYNQWS